MIGTWTPPEGAKKLLEVEVVGKAVQAGSKRGAAVRYKDARGIWKVKIRRDAKGNEFAEVNVADQKAKELKAKAKEIQAAVAEVVTETGFELPPKEVPLAVVVTFWQQRPRTTHYGSGRNERVLKDSAPAYPTTVPDLTKLWRGFEDSLTDHVWDDDAGVVCEILDEDFVDWWVDPKQTFVLYALPATVAERRVFDNSELRLA